MKILITGAAGFVGRHLVHRLREADHDLVGIEQVSAPEVRQWAEAAGLRLEAGDVARPDDLRRLVAAVRPEAVVHLAAVSSVLESVADPFLTWRVNLFGTLNLLEAVREHAPQARVLVISSSEVYGRVPPEAQPTTEDHPLRPATPYAASKAAADLAAFQYAAGAGLNVLRLRPFNHTGPGQSDRFVCSNFARQVAELERKGVPGELRGGNLAVERDFTDVRDVVRAYELALQHGTPGEAYNLAGGVPRPISWIAETLARLAQVPITIVRDPQRERPVDQPVMHGSAARFAAATGWRPEIPLEQTLADLLDYWRERTAAAVSGQRSAAEG